jgi:hypothetical protein
VFNGFKYSSTSVFYVKAIGLRIEIDPNLKECNAMLTLAPPTRNKPYAILFEHRPRYLYVRIRCETTSYPIAKKYWLEILSMQHRRGYDRVLIEKDITNSMPVYDVVLLVSELAHSGTHNVKFAVYDRNYDTERCGFEEMASTNRGLMLRICRTIPEAENWLTTGFIPVASVNADGHDREAA